MFGHAAVVLEGLGTRRLVIHARHREVTDLEEFGRGEKGHVRRVVVERVDDTSFVYDQDGLAAALDFKAAGNACRPGADNDGVVCRTHNFDSTSETSALRA